LPHGHCRAGGERGYEGTQDGPPTGRQAELEGITIHRIEDGKIVEEWERYDNLGFLQQLGLAPEQ
jgi:predicted ester cyclase